MRKTICICVIALVFSLTVFCQVYDKENAENSTRQKCFTNSDSLYNRAEVIKHLARILNKSIPERKKTYGTGYGITESGNSPAGFFIHDLTDIANKDITSTGCIEFKQNHIYHFAPFDYAFSLSHILILEKETLKVFKSINCKNRGDRIEDVLDYLNQKLNNDKNKVEILERVKNYRQYSKFFKMDGHSTLVCQ